MEPHLDSDLVPALRRPRRGRGGGKLAQPPDNVVDLAADAAEYTDLASQERRPELGFLAREGEEFRRPLKRDDRPWLSPVRTEQVSIVVVVENDDRDPASLAQRRLDALDPVETDLHQLSLPTTTTEFARQALGQST